jgi:hypothetical protein
VIDPIECLLNVEEEDRALGFITAGLPTKNTLNGSQEIVDGIGGGTASSKAELGVGEVVATLQLRDKAAMDEMFKGADDNTGHTDGSV